MTFTAKPQIPLLRMTFGITRSLCLVAGLFFSAAPSHASVISIGDIAFNTLIPSASNSPGVNVFAIDNFTGTSSLPPTFPISDSLTLDNSSIALFIQSAPEQVIQLGTLAPGSYTPTSLQFSASVAFTSAVFTATLVPTTFTLSDGSVFHASSSRISVSITPSGGSVLAPDADFSLIQVSSGPSSIPEPASGSLALLALAAVGWFRKRHK